MARRPHRPPAIGRWLLHLARLGDRRAECESDLLELFRARAADRGILRAHARYLADAASVVWHRRLRGADSARTGRRRWWSLDPMLQDIRFAFRLFRRQAGVMTLAVVGLALAIGVNTAAFSFINAFSFRPLGVPGPETVVHVRPNYGRGLDWSFDDFVQLRDRAHRLVPEAWVAESVRVTTGTGDVAATVAVRFVSGGFFRTFGGQPTLGRVLQPGDVVRGAAPVVVLSQAYWTSRFGGDPAVVGTTVSINGARATIVGVLDRRSTGPFSDPPAAWMALGSAAAISDHLGPFDSASKARVSLVARLTEAGTLERAQAEASAIVASVRAQQGERSEGVQLDSAERPRSAKVVFQLLTVMATIGLVLVLACTNVANLLLSGAASRRQEIAARLALGASRGRIVRQLLTESTLLGLCAGALGLLFAIWLVPVLARFMHLPAGADIAPDFRVCAFAVFASLVAGITAGMAPARHGARGDVATALTSGGPSGMAPRSRRTQSTAVAVQAAASMALLALAVLFGRAVLRTLTADVGIDVARFISTAPIIGRTAREGAQSQAFFDRAVDRARSLPGVERVAVAAYPPFGLNYNPEALVRDGRTIAVHENRTSASYFDALGLDLLRGRTFTDDEVRADAPVIVVSERVARALAGAVDPVGSLVERQGREPRRIVGVVKDAVMDWRNPDVGMVYVPLDKADLRGAAQLLIRVAGNAGERARPIRQAIDRLDPELRLEWTLAMNGFDRQLDPGRIVATLTGALGVLALFLAVVGIFGVTAFDISQRRTEVGIRMALGATARDIRRLLLWHSLRPVVIGLAAGLVLAIGAGRGFAAVLYGISPHDPLAVATAVVVLSGAALCAVLGPARRAARMDPARALRQS